MRIKLKCVKTKTKITRSRYLKKNPRENIEIGIKEKKTQKHFLTKDLEGFLNELISSRVASQVATVFENLRLRGSKMELL